MTCSYLVNAQIPEKEKQYLIDFNNSTFGEQWQRKWDLKSDPATWHGVEVANGHVVGLKLYRNNLTGAIPDGISALSHLKSLNLAFNVIEGELPKDLFSLQKFNGRRTISTTIPNIDFAFHLTNIFYNENIYKHGVLLVFELHGVYQHNLVHTNYELHHFQYNRIGCLIVVQLRHAAQPPYK